MLEQDEARVPVVAAAVFCMVGLSHGGWMSLRSLIYSFSIWHPAIVQRTWTLPQGLCQDSAWQFQCLGLWRGWVVKLCLDMLAGSVFGIILPGFAWLHSRWLVQHNDYVAADSWTQWSAIVLDGRIFRSRQRYAKGFKDDQDLIQRATLPIQLPPSNLAFAVATVQPSQKHRNHIWTRFWIPFWHFTTWNLKIGVSFQRFNRLSALPRFVSFDNIDPWCIGAGWCVAGSGREVKWTRWLGLDYRLTIATSNWLRGVRFTAICLNNAWIMFERSPPP